MRTEFPEVLDSTMRGSWKSCPRKFFWNYVQEIVPDGENIHLLAGGAFARGLEVARTKFYTGEESYEESVITGAIALLEHWGNFQPNEGETKTIDRMLGAYEFYHTLYNMPSDVIQPYMTPRGPAVEFNFVLPIPGTKHPRTGNPILYAGRFDMLGSMRGQTTLFVVDEKTTSQLGATWGNQWLIRAQFTGYVWGARQFGHPVAGAVVRGISILKEKYGNAESIVYRQDWQLDAWLDCLRRDCEQMIREWQEYVESGSMAPFTQSLDAACSNYGGCGYLRLCDSPQPEAFIPIYYKPHSWDPTKRASAQ